MTTARAAYIHVPFCVHRCGYCNFTVIAGRDDLMEPYLVALERELSWLGEPRPVETLFLGGGTPTLLPPPLLQRLLAIIRKWLNLEPGYEFSCEANPARLDEPRLQVLRDAGVNRLSLGVQSFSAAKLQALERDHRAEDIIRAVTLARESIEQLSLDLIFAAPDETLAGWQADLQQALALQPDHLSTYGLTYERGTTFWGRRLRGEIQNLDEDLELAMYTRAIETLTAAGFEHYEVSNFARPGKHCRHNETYWAAAEYLAAGPGAARYVDGRRETNHRSTTTWLARVMADQSPVAESETLGPEDRAREALVLALRRMAGISRQAFQQRTGFDLDQLGGDELKKCVARGLLADDGQTVQLTRPGLYVSDWIWSQFLRC